MAAPGAFSTYDVIIVGVPVGAVFVFASGGGVPVAQSRIWKGSISFGLLNIPVTLQSAHREKELHFSMLDRNDFAPIQFRRINADSGREVPFRRIVKGYEYTPGEFVVMGPEDLKAANPKATQTIDIEDFVPADKIDPMLFDKPYYPVPQKGGEKGYFLLRDAIAKTGKAAIGKIVLRTKQHLAAIMARGNYLVLEMLHFAHEVLAADQAEYLKDFHGNHSYNSREMKMARELIEGMSNEWKPAKYRDTYYNDVMKRIQAKIKAGQSHALSEPQKPAAGKVKDQGNVVDLLPLLRRSLNEHKTAPKKRKVRGKPRDKHETAG